MNADDDGVVEAFTVMQMLGSSEDNIRILNVKNLVKPLNEDMVAYITDWNEHNLIRADRKVNSVYKDLLLQILPNVKIKKPKPRADTGVLPRQITGRPLDVNWTAQDRIGKDRLIEYKLNNKNNTVAVATIAFSFEEEIEKLRSSNRKDYKIIALYWKKKNWTFENQEQFNSALRRELKPASALKGYSGEQISAAIEHCDKNYPEWSLETCVKRITDVINKK